MVTRQETARGIPEGKEDLKMCSLSGASVVAVIVFGLLFGFGFVIGNALARLIVKG